MARLAVLHGHLQLQPFGWRCLGEAQPVVVVASGAGFRISREGQALDNGVKGERIRVRLPNRKIIEGVVSGPGQLRVTF